MKRKSRGGRRYTKKRRSTRYRRRRNYKKNAIRTIMQAHETNRRYFNTGTMPFTVGATVLGDYYKCLYQPFNWMAQATSDVGFTGNAIFIRSFMIKGKIWAYGRATATPSYNAPVHFYVYLVWARDEVSTGSIAEGFTESASTVNNWFNGSTSPATWYPNSSRCKILYKKKFRYVPDVNNAYSAAGTANPSQAANAVHIFCKKSVNKMHYFKETAAGAPDSGLYGRNGNYYWLLTMDPDADYSTTAIAFQGTTLTTWKDV